VLPWSPSKLGSNCNLDTQANVDALTDLTRLVRGDLGALHRKSIGSLIVIDVHARDIVRELLDNDVKSSDDFQWQMQLRYHWDESTSDVSVQQSQAKFTYAYEYLGAQARLVVTPMTDRCYMTLTGTHY
jgi:dynein heavy chain, axonemal